MGGNGPLGGGVVLLVENSEEDERLALRAILRAGVDVTVDIAHDAQEALDYLFCIGSNAGRSSPDPCVIFVDVKLGAMSGLELLERIRADRRSRVIPVVMLSGLMDEKVIEQCYCAGANSYLAKPVDIDAFMDTFRAATRYWLNLNRTLENPTQQAVRYLA